MWLSWRAFAIFPKDVKHGRYQDQDVTQNDRSGVGDASPSKRVREDPERIKQKFGLNEEEMEALRSADLLRASALSGRRANESRSRS